MDYEDKYKSALERAREFQKSKDGLCVLTAESIFPELRESEDERIRRNIIAALRGEGYYDCDLTNECIAWLEKQGEKKAIMNVPTREVILSIWDLGNEWKELTNGSISTEYGTQLDYIQKHWHESEYYLREKQGEQKVPSVEFKAKDWYVSKVDGKIHNINISSEKQGEQTPSWSEEDEKMYRMCIDAVEYYHTSEDEGAIRNWLKSLKTRLS